PASSTTSGTCTTTSTTACPTASSTGSSAQSARRPGAEPKETRVSSKTYLVTGGTGFIGAYLVRRLVRDGHTVKVVDNDLRGSRARLAEVADDIEMIVCDVRDVEAMKAAAKGADSLLHLAALNGTENF